MPVLSTDQHSPIPQYPLYSATIDLLQGQKVGYYLDEDAGWELNVQALEDAYQQAIAQGITVSAMCLINPGNPSGSVLSRDNLRAVLSFCVKHRLVLLADEVYQENVYSDQHEFISCKRMAYEMGLLSQNDDNDGIELVSFHSTSKGVFGECGRRGGYMELVGIDPAVKDMIYKLASSTLCSTVSGQVMTALMCRGPAPSDPSYTTHEAEKHEIWSALKSKAQLVSQGLDNIPGFACQPATGSMYCFPSVQMPEGAIQAAQAAGMTPDTLYALDLLEHTGICVVPASGFGQVTGRYGFRTTFLPSEQDLQVAVQKFAEHYQLFCDKYS
jgi:aspartate/methionine/tyrosine aminotransferase